MQSCFSFRSSCADNLKPDSGLPLRTVDRSNVDRKTSVVQIRDSTMFSTSEGDYPGGQPLGISYFSLNILARCASFATFDFRSRFRCQKNVDRLQEFKDRRREHLLGESDRAA